MKSFIALALLLSAPVFGAPAEARALAQSHHGCGLGRFALMPHHIDREYEAWAWAQVKAAGSQADGCNNCPHAGMSPVWAAPGDVCTMQDHMPGSTTHFQQCSESGFADDYRLEAHVKLCLEKGQVDWLWNHGRNGEETEHGHCQTKEGDPHLGPEGLLVCTAVAVCNLPSNYVKPATATEYYTRTTGTTPYGTLTWGDYDLSGCNDDVSCKPDPTCKPDGFMGLCPDKSCPSGFCQTISLAQLTNPDFTGICAGPAPPACGDAGSTCPMCNSHWLGTAPVCRVTQDDCNSKDKDGNRLYGPWVCSATEGDGSSCWGNGYKVLCEPPPNWCPDWLASTCRGENVAARPKCCRTPDF